MEFRIDRKRLLEALRKVVHASDNKSKNKILSQIKLTLNDSYLELKCTDVHITILETIRVTDNKNDGSVLLPAKKFLDLISKIKDEYLDCKFDSRFIITSQKGKFTLPVENPSIFPNIKFNNTNKQITLSIVDFKMMIKKVLFLLPTGELYRDELTNCLLEIKNSHLSLVATDGRRLGKITGEISYNENSEAQKYLIPRKTIGVISTIIRKEEDGDIDLTFSRDKIKVEFDNIILIASIENDKSFPDYRKIIPNETKDLIIKTDIIEETSSRVVLLTEAEHNAINLKMDPLGVVLQTPLESASSGYEELECEWSGEEFDVNISGNHLLSILNHIDSENVILGFDITSKKVMVMPSEDERFKLLYILVPIML